MTGSDDRHLDRMQRLRAGRLAQLTDNHDHPDAPARFIRAMVTALHLAAGLPIPATVYREAQIHD